MALRWKPEAWFRHLKSLWYKLFWYEMKPWNSSPQSTILITFKYCLQQEKYLVWKFLVLLAKYVKLIKPWLNHLLSKRQGKCKYPFYHFLKNSWQLPRLANPQKAKLKIRETPEPRAGKRGEKWVKSHEMSQISYRKDFQWGLWVIGSHTSLQSCSSVNTTICNFTI